MTNFSFDYGNAHWTVIDSNPYVDWTDKAAESGSPTTWPPPRTQPGDSSPSTTLVSTRPASTSSSNRCGSWRPCLRQARSISCSTATSTTISVRFRSASCRTSKARCWSAAGRQDGPGPGGQRPLDARQVVRRPDRHHARRRDLRGHGRGRTAPYNPEQKDDPDSWQKFTEIHLQGSLADRRRCRWQDP